jgi:phospholipid transport system substrate-binding protein
VRNYRNQFTRIIRKDGFPTLIKKMKDKLSRGEVQ